MIEIVVPDNLKTGVTKPDYYEPSINLSYQELARNIIKSLFYPPG